jgi:hypothetical protein
VVFWLLGVYEPIIENAYFLKIYLKNQKQNYVHPEFTHEFSGKGTFYVTRVERQKCPVNSRASKIVFSTWII